MKILVKMSYKNIYFLNIYSRAGGGSQTFFSTHGNHLPSLSGVHGLKDFLHSDHLLEWFDVRIYTYGSVLKSNFYHQITQEDGHYGENPSNHELLTVRGGDCRASKKMFRGLLPPYWSQPIHIDIIHHVVLHGRQWPVNLLLPSLHHCCLLIIKAIKVLNDSIFILF